MITLPKEINEIVKDRVKPHLDDLQMHHYGLLWLAMACYMQGFIDSNRGKDDKTGD